MLNKFKKKGPSLILIVIEGMKAHWSWHTVLISVEVLSPLKGPQHDLRSIMLMSKMVDLCVLHVFECLKVAS